MIEDPSAKRKDFLLHLTCCAIKNSEVKYFMNTLAVIPAYAGIPLLFNTSKFNRWDSCLRKNDGQLLVLSLMHSLILIAEHVTFIL
jgi:hypothetical protein